ncbi:MAG: alpha/beta fold hydrolase [Deltaproteobacteria bacterium]|nr:alpha/beta fold hydrolase [Deltaproteobacteria bacterium]
MTLTLSSKALALVLFAVVSGCGSDAASAPAGPPAADAAPDVPAARGCRAEAELLTTAAGVPFVRTPDSCFSAIADFPYTPKYVEIDGLRQAYVDEGPPGADPILLLHGQPSWSYLYRKMIPVLVAAGHRVIAMDHVGLGRSDKPTDIRYYSYLGHISRLERFVEALKLQNVTMFCQDWGSLIGLHVAGKHPDWFARVVVGDGNLPVVPAGFVPFPPVENPDQLDDTIVPPFAAFPAQQVSFYDAEGNLLGGGDPMKAFATWMAYAMKSPKFHPAEVIEAMTWFPLPAAAAAAYDAPFPSRVYMAGIRVFPSLANQLGGVNQAPWEGLKKYTRPFLTIWASNDPGNLGSKSVQANLVDNIPGAAGQPHVRLPEASHFLQDDQGPEIAKRMVDFIAATPR